MMILITLIHVLVCLFLIVVVLLQSGKAADLAGAFGGMGSQTVFGPRGSATVLTKATTISAIAFMLTSMTLSIYATRGGGAAPSLLDKATKAPVSQQKGAPATTAPPITVTPVVDGKAGPAQVVPGGVQVPAGTAPTAPAQQAPAQPGKQK